MLFGASFSFGDISSSVRDEEGPVGGDRGQDDANLCGYDEEV